MSKEKIVIRQQEKDWYVMYLRKDDLKKDGRIHLTFRDVEHLNFVTSAFITDYYKSKKSEK